MSKGLLVDLDDALAAYERAVRDRSRFGARRARTRLVPAIIEMLDAAQRPDADVAGLSEALRHALVMRLPADADTLGSTVIAELGASPQVDEFSTFTAGQIHDALRERHAAMADMTVRTFWENHSVVVRIEALVDVLRHLVPGRPRARLPVGRRARRWRRVAELERTLPEQALRRWLRGQSDDGREQVTRWLEGLARARLAARSEFPGTFAWALHSLLPFDRQADELLRLTASYTPAIEEVRLHAVQQQLDAIRRRCLANLDDEPTGQRRPSLSLLAKLVEGDPGVDLAGAHPRRLARIGAVTAARMRIDLLFPGVSQAIVSLARIDGVGELLSAREGLFLAIPRTGRPDFHLYATDANVTLAGDPIGVVQPGPSGVGLEEARRVINRYASWTRGHPA